MPSRSRTEYCGCRIGTLAVGKKADINVLDISRVEERQPKRVYDFPGGAPRLIQRGVGYLNTFVNNGKIILENDELNGNSGGKMFAIKVIESNLRPRHRFT